MTVLPRKYMFIFHQLWMPCSTCSMRGVGTKRRRSVPLWIFPGRQGNLAHFKLSCTAPFAIQMSRDCLHHSYFQGPGFARCAAVSKAFMPGAGCCKACSHTVPTYTSIPACASCLCRLLAVVTCSVLWHLCNLVWVLKMAEHVNRSAAGNQIPALISCAGKGGRASSDCSRACGGEAAGRSQRDHEHSRVCQPGPVRPDAPGQLLPHPHDLATI